MTEGLETLEFQQNELIISKDSAFDGVYIVQEGTAGVVKLKNKQVIPIALIEKGEYIGETALFTGQNHSSNVMAITPVKLTKIPKEAIDKQIQGIPAWLVTLIKGLIKRLHHLNEVIRKNGIVPEKVETKIELLQQKIKQEKLKKSKEKE